MAGLRIAVVVLAVLLGSKTLVGEAAAMPAYGAATANTSIADPVQHVRWVCGPHRCWWRVGPGPYWGAAPYPYWGRPYWGFAPYWGPRPYWGRPYWGRSYWGPYWRRPYWGGPYWGRPYWGWRRWW